MRRLENERERGTKRRGLEGRDTVFFFPQEVNITGGGWFGWREERDRQIAEAFSQGLVIKETGPNPRLLSFFLPRQQDMQLTIFHSCVIGPFRNVAGAN